jgi:hypothetical protein
MQKKHLLLIATASAIILGGLAFAFSQSSLFQGNLDMSDRTVIDPLKAEEPSTRESESTGSDLVEVDTPPATTPEPAATCGTIQVSVQDQAGNFIRDLQEENLIVLNDQQNEIQYALDPCPMGLEEYAPDFYQVNLPVGQEYYLGFGTNTHVMQVSTLSARPMEDARLAETLDLTLAYSFRVDLEDMQGTPVRKEGRVEANGATCIYLASTFAPDQNSYGCPVSIYDQDIRYTVEVSGYDSLEANVDNPRNNVWNPSFTLTAKLAGGRPIAYIEVLDENDASIPNLQEENFSIQDGAINSLIELPTGFYQLELNDFDQSSLLTVSVNEYEDLSQSIRSWSTPSAAESNVYTFALNKKSEQTQKACDNINIESSITAIKQSEAPKTVTLTVSGSSKTETSLLSIVPHWLAQAFHFEGPEAILASEDSWTGTLRLSTTGSGTFSENNISVEGEEYSKTVNYTASPGETVTASIVGESCTDSVRFTSEAEEGAQPTQSTPVEPESAPAPSIQNGYLVIKVKNEDEEAIENLDESDFKITGEARSADDFDEIEDGLYEFTLPQGEYDFSLTINAYAKGTLNNAETFSTRSSAEQNNYTITLRQLSLLTDDDYVCTKHFKDIKDDLLCRMRDAGIIQGTGGAYFGLTTITEAEALKTMLSSRGYDEADGRALPPVPRSVTGYQTGWYDAWYRIAVKENIIRDFADPNSPIPRERYAVLAARTWKKELRGFDASDIPFTDVRIQDPFTYAVLLMHQTEVDVPGEGKTPIIEGYADGSFKPNSLITRKDAMYLLYRALLAWQDELPIETEGLSF